MAIGLPPAEVKIYTTKDIKAYPAAASGVIFYNEGSTAWAYGSWEEVVPVNTITEDFIIVGFVVYRGDASIQCLIEIGVGAAGSEDTKIQIPIPSGLDTYGVGRFVIVVFPIPIKFDANSRVAVRVADSSTAYETYSAGKIIYIELPL